MNIRFFISLFKKFLLAGTPNLLAVNPKHTEAPGQVDCLYWVSVIQSADEIPPD